MGRQLVCALCAVHVQFLKEGESVIRALAHRAMRSLRKETNIRTAKDVCTQHQSSCRVCSEACTRSPLSEREGPHSGLSMRTGTRLRTSDFHGKRRGRDARTPFRTARDFCAHMSSFARSGCCSPWGLEFRHAGHAHATHTHTHTHTHKHTHTHTSTACMAHLLKHHAPPPSLASRVYA